MAPCPPPPWIRHCPHLYSPSNGSIEEKNTYIQQFTINKNESRNKQYAITITYHNSHKPVYCNRNIAISNLLTSYRRHAFYGLSALYLQLLIQKQNSSIFRRLRIKTVYTESVVIAVTCYFFSTTSLGYRVQKL